MGTVKMCDKGTTDALVFSAGIGENTLELHGYLYKKLSRTALQMGPAPELKDTRGKVRALTAGELQLGAREAESGVPWLVCKVSWIS